MKFLTVLTNEMNDALGHNSALKGYTGPGTTWPNENFVIKHAPCAGSITRYGRPYSVRILLYYIIFDRKYYLRDNERSYNAIYVVKY